MVMLRNSAKNFFINHPPVIKIQIDLLKNLMEKVYAGVAETSWSQNGNTILAYQQIPINDIYIIKVY
jgi:hypothetical protein